jgi:iron-sulfur cluster repair protein YtfE (RIC family)
MDQFNDIKIKELIKQFPGLVDVLEEYHIDCLHCKKGSCRLKDIVEAENLSMNDEIEFMARIKNALSS